MKKLFICKSIVLLVAANTPPVMGSIAEAHPQYMRLVKYEVLSHKGESASKVSKHDAKHLKTLAQCEIDQYFIIEQAQNSLNKSDSDLYEKLESMRNETRNFVKTLANAIVSANETPPSFGTDFKGFFMKEYVMFAGLGSNEAVLKALISNLETIKNTYNRLLKKDMSHDAKNMVHHIMDAKVENLKYLHDRIGS